MISFIYSGSEKFIDTGFLAINQLMLEEVASYNVWAYSNSLIKNLTIFEDGSEIGLLNVVMQSNCKQPEDTFIQMASPKIDFYFEFFKQVFKNLLKLTAIFIASLMEKKHMQPFILPVDRLFCEFVGKEKSCGFNTKIFSA